VAAAARGVLAARAAGAGVWPIVWLVSLPFRLIGIALEGVFALLTAIVTLPARLLGWRPAVSAG